MQGLSQKENYYEQRSEVIDGKTIMLAAMPAVNHNRVAGNIYRIFANYLHGKKRCEAFSDSVDVHFDEENIFVPDAMIVCDKSIIRPDGIYGAPDLVVEALSYSTEKYDKGKKKIIYEKYGVKEYWIADPRSKTVEVYQLFEGKFTLDNVYSVYPDWEWNRLTDEEKAAASIPLKVSLYDDLTVDVREIFERV